MKRWIILALFTIFIQCANDQSVVNEIRENGIEKKQ